MDHLFSWLLWWVTAQACRSCAQYKQTLPAGTDSKDGWLYALHRVASHASGADLAVTVAAVAFYVVRSCSLSMLMHQQMFILNYVIVGSWPRFMQFIALGLYQQQQVDLCWFVCVYIHGIGIHKNALFDTSIATVMVHYDAKYQMS